MKGFFIKKAFFDGWDNLIPMVFFNLLFVLILVLSFSVLSLMESMTVLAYVLLVLLLFVQSLITGGVAGATLSWSNYQRDTFQAFKEGLVRNIRHSILYFFLQLFLFLLVFLVIPFYFSVDNPVSLVITVVLFWLTVILLLACPFYFPLMCRLPGDRPLKTLKKCFIIVADNLLFAIFFGIYNIVCIAFSVFTMGLVPGVTGMQLAAQDAIKLLMFKYDYLEKHPADRKNINWEDLLYDEREKVGPRSLKNMIFPWKD